MPIGPLLVSERRDESGELQRKGRRPESRATKKGPHTWAVGLKRKKAAYMAVQGEDAMIRCPPPVCCGLASCADRLP